MVYPYNGDERYEWESREAVCARFDTLPISLIGTTSATKTYPIPAPVQ